MSDETSERTNQRLTRREVLGVLGAGTVGAALGGRAPTKEAPRSSVPRAASPVPPVVDRAGPVRPVAPAASPFDLGDVELLESAFVAARERDGAYMLSLDPDRLLHNFRVNAGLEPKAPVYGGWESQEPWVNIRCHGHTLGHWLTAGSFIVASTGDARFRERIDYMVDELRDCQDAEGSGLICAFPDGAEQLENALRGERFIGVPWYTTHKVMAGLRDAHVHAGNQTAIEVLVRLTDWIWDVTEPLSDEAFQQMLDREHGGMNEVLADVHAITGDPRYLTLAERFCHQAILGPLSRGVDELDGLHSNTQIPKIVGFQRLYELTGRPDYRAAARFFWDTVVERRSFVTGGHGDLEHFFPPEEFPEHLGSAKTMETCCSHNMLRLTRLLFADEPSARYADFYERLLYNGILASQDPDMGMCTYFQATRPGYLKLYHTPIDSFWCCTGSGMENHAKYNDSIYFQGTDDLWVNLFVPSAVMWRAKGLVVTQTTRFPDEETVTLTVEGEAPARAVMHIRHPSWCAAMEVTVNGSPVADVGEPGSYVSIDREWSSGDRVGVGLPMTMRVEAYPGAPDRVAFLYGPLVLAGRLGTEGLFPGADILRNERTSGQILDIPVEVPVLAGSPDTVAESVRPVAGPEPLTFETAGVGRPRDVTLIPYHRLHHERYNLYWEVRSL
jgi:DUF1680 family protein